MAKIEILVKNRNFAQNSAGQKPKNTVFPKTILKLFA